MHARPMHTHARPCKLMLGACACARRHCARKACAVCAAAAAVKLLVRSNGAAQLEQLGRAEVDPVSRLHHQPNTPKPRLRKTRGGKTDLIFLGLSADTCTCP